MRSPFRFVVMAALAVVVLLAGWLLLFTPGLKPVVVSIYEPPIIQAETRIKDIGVVHTDDKVHTEFLLYNVGGKHLRITDVDTSCGCTLANMSKRVIAPGDFSHLAVDLDTSLKQGKIRKQITIKSNDPARPSLSLFIVGEVKPKAMASHSPIQVQTKDRLVLFKGQCATCHVDLGKGKTGKALFVADCAMCHGSAAQGNHEAGPSLLGKNYEDPAILKHLRDIIANGSPHSPQMPPFAKTAGGPLNEDEIDSLVRFLKYQNTQAQLGLLDKPSEEELENEAAFSEALQQPH